jgi:hypothetical protein
MAVYLARSRAFSLCSFAQPCGDSAAPRVPVRIGANGGV